MFLDDICVTGPDDAAHLANLKEVLKRLEENLRINPKNCRWFLPEVSYLGLRINKEGIHPTDQKVTAVRNAPSPENVGQLRTYLGMLNHFSRFCPKLSAVAAPLYAFSRRMSSGDGDNKRTKSSKPKKLSSVPHPAWPTSTQVHQ